MIEIDGAGAGKGNRTPQGFRHADFKSAGVTAILTPHALLLF